MKRILPGLLACIALSAYGSEAKMEEVKVSTDLPTLERGAEEVVTVCGGCHGLKYIKYRDLLNLGIAKDKVDAWRGDKSLDTSLEAQMPAEVAKAAFGGIAPPDLSLMAAAREGEERYLYSYLIGYHKDDKGGLTNTMFPETRMPDVLGMATASSDQERADIDKRAQAVTSFLVWASDPHAQERKRMGYYVLAYVAVMTVLLFMWKNRIWREIDRRPKIV